MGGGFMVLEGYDFELLKNEAETFVLRELEEQLKTVPEDMCRCNECVVDIAAIALNSVKPLYRFSILGTLYVAAMTNEQAYADSVQKAVADAIKKVRDNPAHD
jgi:competence protein ComFB